MGRYQLGGKEPLENCIWLAEPTMNIIRARISRALHQRAPLLHTFPPAFRSP